MDGIFIQFTTLSNTSVVINVDAIDALLKHETGPKYEKYQLLTRSSILYNIDSRTYELIFNKLEIGV